MTTDRDIQRAARVCIATFDGVLRGDPDAMAVLMSDRWAAWCDALGWCAEGVRALLLDRVGPIREHAREMDRARRAVARLIRWRGERRALEILYGSRRMSDGEIAAVIGCGRTTVQRARERLGIGARPRGRAPQQRRVAAREAA